MIVFNIILWLIVVYLQIVNAVNQKVDRNIKNGANFDEANKSARSVIIVGAGAAGIAAGAKLYDNNFNVTILEAENRRGGRINSLKFGDAIIDLGAEWCHGEVGNIVYGMVKDLDILQHSNYNSRLHVSNNRTVINSKFNKELLEIYDEIYDEGELPRQPNYESLGTYFSKLYNETVIAKWASCPRKQRIALMCLETFNHLILVEEGSFSWYDESANNDYRVCSGDLELNWNGHGYKTILEILLRKFPKEDKTFNLDQRIFFNKEVTRIIHKDDSAEALCADGTSYIGDHVIVTPSLGVLKAQHPTLFTPNLSKSKIQAIDNLGIAAVHKVMVHFSERWWPRENFSAGIYFVWAPEDKDKLTVDWPFGPIQNGQHWLRNMASMYRVEKNPQVLSVWFSGELVPDIELMDDNFLIEGIKFALDKFFGHKYNVSRPDEIRRYKWYTNKHFRGTYSFPKYVKSKQGVPSSLKLRTALAEPVRHKGVPRLLFAGEATHPYYFGTVHGAIETGQREAKRLINFY